MLRHHQNLYGLLLGLFCSSLVLAENTTYGTNAGAALTASADANVLIGENAGAANTNGDYITAVGANAGRYALYGSAVVIGFNAGATGSSYGSSDILGTRSGYNFATGYVALFGFEAGYSMTSQSHQTFAGSEAGYFDTGSASAAYNNYLGYRAGYFIAGIENSAVGSEALYGRMAGNEASANSVLGYRAAYGIGEGDGNVALGEGAGYDLDAGSYNTLIGARAGERVQDNSSVPGDYSYSGSSFVGALSGLNSQSGAVSNSFFGAGAGATNQTGDNNLIIGAFTDFADWSAVDDVAREIIFSAEMHTSTGITALATDANRGTLIGAAGQLSADDVTGLGYGVNLSASGAIAIGAGSSASHSESIAIGYGAQSLGDYLAVLGNGGTSLWHPANHGLTSLGSSGYRFTNVYSQTLDVTASSGTALAITLAADAAEDAGDTWQLGVADEADFSLSNNLSGSQVVLFSLSHGGDLTMAGDVNVLSDLRYKKGIVAIDDALTLVNQLQPKRYYWLAAAGRDQREHFGLIAQEVAELLPEVVKTRADGYLSVNYPALLPLLAQASGELAARQDAQIQQFSALEARLEAIEAAIDGKGKSLQ